MGKLWIAFSAGLLLLAPAALPQEYDGPRPPKPDIPYLLHAGDLVELEAGEARVEDRKRETANLLAGAASPVKTPLAEPIFIFESDKIPAQKLALYQLDVVKGQREIAFPKDAREQFRKGPHPKHLMVRKLAGKLFWLEANEVLDNGQYCLSPEGSQAVFCFEIF
ncbi:MAG: hypothetical protein KIT09_08025 [Bryobacteraceae bacterium]|nr:hypothetical protein [Bryobacteraceae bacterium]